MSFEVGGCRSPVKELWKYAPVCTLLIWGALHIYFCSHRSMWQDELTRYWQLTGNFKAALISLFSEPSPFAPGELFLGFISKFLFSWFTDFETWARIPSVLFGLLTLGLALRTRNMLFTALVFFSVALTSFSTQARPYGALFFGGAIAFSVLLQNKGKLSFFEEFLCWFNLIFGHIYGICFLGAACVLRRRWGKAAFAFGYVTALFVIYRHFHPSQLSSWTLRHFPGFIGTLRASLGVNGNPHKASYVLLILSIFGARDVTRRGVISGLELCFFFLMTVLGPIAATYVAKYFFLPRQVIGASFGFLFLAAQGLEALTSSIHKLDLARLARVSTVCLLGVAPWVATTILHIPPFPDQPMHHYKAQAFEVARRGEQNVLFLDPGGLAYFYLNSVLGAPESRTIETVPGTGYQVIHSKYGLGVNVYFVEDRTDSVFWTGKLKNCAECVDYINRHEPKFDRLYYTYESLDLPTSIQAERTW